MKLASVLFVGLALGLTATATLNAVDPFREIPVDEPPQDLPNPDQGSNAVGPEEESSREQEFSREEVSGTEEFGPKEEFGREEGSGTEEFGPKEEFGAEEEFGPEEETGPVEESGPETEADAGLEAGLVGKTALEELFGHGDEDADIRKLVADMEQRALRFPSIGIPNFIKTISSLRYGTLKSIKKSISSVFKALLKIFDMVKVIRRELKLVQGWITPRSAKNDRKPNNRPPRRGRPRAQKRQKSRERSKPRDSPASHHNAQPLAMDKHKPLAVKPNKSIG